MPWFSGNPNPNPKNENNANNRLNKLLEEIKNKILIININEHSKPCTQITKNQTKLLKDNIEVVIICAQNSLNATKQNSGGAHFPQKFGEMLELKVLGFRLFSKMDATPLRKRTKGGFSTSNVRTRIYVRNVTFENLTNQQGKKNVNYLKQSYPNGNQRFPYSKGTIKPTNYRHFKINETSKNTKITFKNNTKPNNGPNILDIIEFKTSKIYYHNHQGIIKTKLVLKYKQCEYGLDIINMGEDTDNTNFNNNFNKPLKSNITTWGNNTIICSPYTRISNNNSLKSLKINNIGKNKNQHSNTQNNTTSNNRTPLLRNQPNNEGFFNAEGPPNRISTNQSNFDTRRNTSNLSNELAAVNTKNTTALQATSIRKRGNEMVRSKILGKNNSVRITNNDLSSINNIMKKKDKFNSTDKFKEALKEALENNKNIVKNLASKLTEKYQQIQNSTNNNRDKISKKAKYIYIRLVLKSLDPELTFNVKRTSRTQNITSRVSGTSNITNKMNNTRGALLKRGKKLENIAEKTGEMANQAGNFRNATGKLLKQQQEQQSMIPNPFAFLRKPKKPNNQKTK
jgi:hypothetical protein